jgi:Uma2 family endonuclease
MPMPMLVIEIVSPGEPGSANYDRDYVEKRREYAQRSIPEYWLVDPIRSAVIVLTLVGQSYQAQEFRGSDLIVSYQFPALTQTAVRVLSAGQETEAGK